MMLEYRCPFCEKFESNSPLDIEIHWEICDEYENSDGNPYDVNK